MKTETEKIFRILVADDDDIILDMYREIFAQHTEASMRQSIQSADAEFLSTSDGTLATLIGFSLVYVRGAEEALAEVERANQEGEPFSSAFLDVRMPPGPDGLWAAEQIRKLDRDIDIVLVTAYSDFEPQMTASKIGPANKLFYLKKPFDTYEILQLATALSGKWLAERKIRDLAYFDGLTGLPNRRLFLTRVSQAIELAMRAKRHLAVMFIDLDRFKRINDTLGHHVGDLLLQKTAERLSSCLRASDALMRSGTDAINSNVARLGGDEFTILLSEIHHSSDAILVGERIIQRVSKPFEILGHKIHITPSIGIATFPEDGKDAETLIKHADMSMYVAKGNKTNRYQCFSKQMQEAALRRLAVENRLRDQLPKGGLSIVYQPICHVEDIRIYGVEALIRWKDAELGDMTPQEFIPIAEDCGLIIALGEWVIREVCAQLHAWRSAGVPLSSVSVNVSTLEFSNSGFVEFIDKTLNEYQLPPDCLELEITESLLMKEANYAIPILQALRNRGIRVVIDDFGSGYSSLGMLSELPVDALKIDPTFTNDINSDTGKATVTAAILALAKELRLKVVAEGVETIEQLDFLRRKNCGVCQGYLISHPLNAEAVADFVNAHQKPVAFSRISEFLGVRSA